MSWIRRPARGLVSLALVWVAGCSSGDEQPAAIGQTADASVEGGW